MKMNVKQYYHLFLICRPYSWINISLTPLLALTIIKQWDLVNILFDGLIAIIIWNLGMLMLEYSHKDKFITPNIGAILSLLIIVILIIIFLYKINLISIIIFLIGIVVILIYSLKIYIKSISYMSPFIRGFSEFLLILLFISFHNKFININILFFNFNILLSYFLFVSTRNLIGDLRDLKRDPFSLPKLLGVKRTSFLILIIILFILYLTPGISKFIVILILLFYIYCNYFEDYYLLHKLMILLTAFYILALVSELGFNHIKFAILILVIHTFLNNFYDKVPRN